MGSPYAYQSGVGGGGSTAASGGTGKNYLGTINGVNNNGDFEGGTTNKWSLGTTGTLTNGLPTGAPTFGSGASGNLSIAAFNSSPLAGSWSLRYASSAATTAGNCLASDAFTIDLEDQAKVMTVKFYFRAQVNPTNGNWSGTSSNSFAWAIYDVTNSVWIAPAGSFGMTQSSGVGLCTGTFQTSANGTQYRLVVYNANASAGAITVDFDDFFVGPQTAPIGAVITDPTVYTANTAGFGTLAGQSILWWMEGAILRIKGGMTTGTTSATPGLIYFPPGLVTSTAITTGQLAGKAITSTNLNEAIDLQFLMVPGANYVVLSRRLNTSGSNNPLSTTTNANAILSSNSDMAFDLSIPIAGWSSNVQMSNDTDTRVTDFAGTQTSQVVTANVTNIAFTSVKDTHAAWNGTQYAVPVSGDYVMCGSLVTSTILTGVPYVNGAAYAGLWSTSGGSGAVSSGSVLVTGLKAGDLLSIRSNTNATITSGALQIYRLSGPATIAASESVNMRYTNSAGTAIGTSFGVIPFANKVYDSHNAYNTSTGIYTVPVSGKYAIKCTIQTVAVNLATSQGCAIAVFKNGSEYGYLGSTPGTGVSATKAPSGSDTIDCLAGDQLAIYSVSDVATTLVATASRNHIAIERVGN